jgi:hypothetical protein
MILSQNTSSHSRFKVLDTFCLANLDWLRLVIIVGGYILLRPILVRYAARLQEQQLEKADAEISKEGLIEEQKQDTKARKDLQWGVDARIRQREAAYSWTQLGDEDDSDHLGLE